MKVTVISIIVIVIVVLLAQVYSTMSTEKTEQHNIKCSKPMTISKCANMNLRYFQVLSLERGIIVKAQAWDSESWPDTFSAGMQKKKVSQ